MAYTQGFGHDIFISFSHEDNLVLEGEKGWVTQFRESLEVWLRRRGLKGLSIWWDEEKLRGNTDFDACIEDCLAKTALLVVLHSRNYRQSEYCRKELDWFVYHAQRHPLGLTIGDNRRILNILINNIPHQEWSESGHWTKPLSGTTGIPLHDADKVDDFGDPISLERFNEKLKPIVTATVETLRPDVVDCLVSRLLAHDPAERYPGAEALLAELRHPQDGHARRRSADTTADDADKAADSAPAPDRADWNPEVLGRIALEMAKSVGPIAPILVRQTAETCTSVSDLCSRLAERLDDPTARATFLRHTRPKATAFDIGPSTAPIAHDTASILALSAEQQQTIESALSEMLGPIAHTLLLRTRKETTSVETLCRSLAGHMDQERNREIFLSRVRPLW